MIRIKSLVASLAFAISTAAAADPMITVDWFDNVFAPYNGVGVGTVTHPTGTVNALAGRFHGSVTALTEIDASELIDNTTDFFAYCHDLAQLIGPGAVYQVQFGAGSAQMRDWLGAVNYVLNGNVNGGDPFAWLHPADKQTAAAIQLGIWEAMHSDGFNLTAGSVQFSSVPSSGATSTGARYLAFNTARTNGAGDLDDSYVMRLINGRYQDVITGRNPPDLLIPEPGTLVLLGAAAAIAGLARRRRH